MAKAARKNAALKPMSGDHITVDVVWKFSADAYSKIEMGYVPQEFPGDPYAMFMEENVFYIGTMGDPCLYMLWFTAAENAYQVTKIQLAVNPHFDRNVQIKDDLGTIGMILYDTFRVRFEKLNP